jgi:exopolysaccharide biosynthesis polyprenyl glycosylphosphotransferase
MTDLAADVAGALSAVGAEGSTVVGNVDSDAAPAHALAEAGARVEAGLLRRVALLLVGMDAMGLAVAALVAAWIGTRFAGSAGPVWARLVFVPVLVTALAGYGLYRDRRRRIVRSAFHDVTPVIHSLLIGGLASWALSVWWLRSAWGVAVSPAEAVVAGSVGLVAVLGGRVAGSSLVDRAVHSADRVLVVGSGQVADAVCARLGRVGDVEVLGLVDDDPPPGSAVVGGLADLPALCQGLGVDRVVVAFSRTPSHETAEMLRSLAGWVPISVVPRFFELVSWRSQVEELHGLPVIDVAPPRLGMWASFGKRTFDVVVSAVGLFLLAPVLAAIAIGVKLSSPGPVFFRQLRSGRGGRPFAIFKFRTMVDGADTHREALWSSSDGDGLFKMREDPRVTRLGSWLRKTSLDELPQLFNVLIGHMSLVGPRPFTLSESSEINGWAARRFEVRPGMTGLWQVSGRSELSWQDLRRLDYIYVASWSFWWDLKILWQTPSIVSRRQGAY